MQYASRQTGVSLLEVMIALLIMSLGLLGMAGLQAATAKYRINTQSHAAVAQLISDLTERLRVNPDAAGPSFHSGVGEGISQYVLRSTWSVQSQASLDIHKDCITAACSSSERAEFDMTAWRQNVRNALPQGAAFVDGDRKSGIHVTLMWMDKEQTRATENEETGRLDRKLTKSLICKMDADSTMVHNCCPADAAAPAGVRCLRMSFLP